MNHFHSFCFSGSSVISDEILGRSYLFVFELLLRKFQTNWPKGNELKEAPISKPPDLSYSHLATAKEKLVMWNANDITCARD